MSEQSPLRPTELSYATAAPFGNARSLLRLAFIFTCISAGLDVLGGFGHIGMIFFMHHVSSRMATLSAAATSGPSSMPIVFPMTFIIIEYGLCACLCFAAGTAKFVCGTKLHRLRPNAFGWGLAAGIVGCTELWCNIACVLPLAAGIFTIVILCRENVRAYLQASPEQRTAYGA